MNADAAPRSAEPLIEGSETHPQHGDALSNPGRDRRFLKVMHSNLDCIKNKLPEVKMLFANQDIDIFCATEVCPENYLIMIEDSHIAVDGYEVFSNFCSKGCKRGTVIYVKNNFKTKILSLFPYVYTYPWVEFVAVECQLLEETLIVENIYRSPSAPNANDSNKVVADFVSKIATSSSNSVPLTGDFNMPDVIWVDGYGFTTPNNPAQTTLNSVANLALIQLIDQPTRYRDGQNPTTLELVFTYKPDTVMSIKYLPAIGSSDHNCVMFSGFH
ncbi:hypothetical protein QYM36_002446 [Artemia franciscana]|uniref:Endonuclease/exonuclease/phosphatase domain-containing protein n=1 Tax=Artemia franciscana TaxID=6661 RepID=A0AA88ICJ7_ARTSF|nr:hypothetical protein QYM36_002446 [Artemia franciscana]